MPTKETRRTFEVGYGDKLSTAITLPKSYANWLKNVTEDEKPEIEIWGDSVIILKPVKLNMDEKQVMKLVKQIAKNQRKLEKLK